MKTQIIIQLHSTKYAIMYLSQVLCQFQNKSYNWYNPTSSKIGEIWF